LLPNSAHRGDYSTPYEALIQKKVPFKHLHHFTFAFGEECFYHEPRELREHTHGCEKSLRAIFLGFSAKKKGYQQEGDRKAAKEGGKQKKTGEKKNSARKPSPSPSQRRE
jgi:hypothetical protein